MENFFKKFLKNKKLKKILTPPHKKRKFKPHHLLYYFLYVLIAFVFVVAILFAWFSKDLPTPSKIASRKATESTKIYDRTGTILLYETGDQKRTIVQSDQISQYLKDATVATEDASFYKNHGFESKAVFSAIVEKLTGKRAVARGGSTITQQYVKNALLDSNRTLSRKIKELILSVELEMMYNKDQILTMYLNEIPYGNSTAGAEAASRMYFGKPAKDLTLSEAATLAAIPKAPTYYSPYGTHTDELKGRKNYVLDRMVETGKITKDQATAAKAEDDLVLGTTLKQRKDTMLAPHFAMYVLEQIADKYGEEKIQKEGLKIITTLDYDKQKIAEQSVADGTKKILSYGASNAGLVAVDPKTGQILAMVGSRDYYDTSIDGNVNITDSLRQPGSSFKPFTYSTLFKQKDFSPSHILYDFQTDFGGGYVPKNYNGNFNGPVTIRQALDNSLNIPAVKALSLAGIDNVIKTATDLGITSLTNRNKYGLSFALGVAEVRPVEMAGAFGVFANGGVKMDTTPVLKITDSNGKVVYDFDANKPKGKTVLDPQIAYEISNILLDNSARSLVFGTHSQLYFPNRTVAAKTGTTSDNKDAWTMGYTPSIAVAVWVGNNNGKIMKAGADGSIVAAPIFHTFIDNSLKDKPNEDFVRPEGIQDVTVEKYSNKLPSEFSTETTKDIFAAWQVPTDKDNIHVQIKVCRSNGKLAPADLPDAYAELRTFTNLHSERPDNPGWENPVRAWAESHGMYNIPPKDYCSKTDASSTISITSPAYNDTVSGNETLSVSIDSPTAVKSVEYFLDDVSIGSATASPYSISYDFSAVSEGQHRLSAVLTDGNGITTKSESLINVSKNVGPAIGSVSQQSVSPTSAKITWTTDTLSSSQALLKKSGDSSYTIQSPIDGTMTTAHSVTVDGLVAGTTYYYRVVSTDASGQQSFSTEKSFTQ